jgi:hypothetical protein
LASAASIAANKDQMPANTFNAAGLHRNTLCFRDAAGYLYPETEAYRGAFQQFRLEHGNTGIIQAFYVEFDALTHMQNNLPPVPKLGNIPRAVGRQIKLIGNINTAFKASEKEVLETYEKMPQFGLGMDPRTWISLFISWLGEITAQHTFLAIDGMKMHRMRSVLYGLLVERYSHDNVYFYRVFDIFGGDEKEDGY